MARHRRRRSSFASLPLLLVVAACSDSAAETVDPLAPPLGLEGEALVVSAANPMTAEKYELGKQLFFDTRLSGTGQTSCSSCHLTEHAFTDQRAFSPKDDGKLNTRNSPTVYNVGYLAELYWDGRAKGLENNVLAAWTGQVGGKPAEVATKLAAIPEYKAAFEKAFQAAPSEETIVHALASFLRGLRSGDSAYDRHNAGQAGAMSDAAQKGFALFSKDRCTTCHVPPLFTDRLYHNTGIGMAAESPDLGAGAEKLGGDKAKAGAFKTPTLREVAKTGPWFHDGSAKTLREAVATMAKGGIDNPNKDPKLLPTGWSDEEIDQVVAFLESLTGNQQFTPPTLPK